MTQIPLYTSPSLPNITLGLPATGPASVSTEVPDCTFMQLYTCCYVGWCGALEKCLCWWIWMRYHITYCILFHRCYHLFAGLLTSREQILTVVCSNCQVKSILLSFTQVWCGIGKIKSCLQQYYGHKDANNIQNINYARVKKACAKARHDCKNMTRSKSMVEQEMVHVVMLQR